MRKILAMLVAVATLSLAAEAHAAIQLTLQRTSDTTAILTGTGSITAGQGPYVTQLNLDGLVTSVISLNSGSVTGDFAIGGIGLDAEPTTILGIVTLGTNLGTFTDGMSPTGSSVLDLAGTGATFLPIGTTGPVTTNVVDGGPVTVGDFVVTPVPAALPLMLSGIAGLAWLRRRQTAAAA